MNTYGFNIKKQGLTISLTSKNKQLIAEEYAKFMVDILGTDIKTVMQEHRENQILQNNMNILKNSLKTPEEIQESDVEDDTQEEVVTGNLSEDFVELETEQQDEITVQNEEKQEKIEDETPVKSKKLPKNFADLLAQKEKSESSNVVEKKDSELQNTYIQMQSIIKEKKLKDECDFVIAAAFCLTHYENMMRFTEEQLNSKIAPFADEPLNHNSVLDVVAKNYLKVLPDFTGVSDTIEYELTEQGEEYFSNEL